MTGNLGDLRGWLADNAQPIDHIEPGDPDDGTDLDGLVAALRRARVVALGESTHGTREHFLLKDRIIRKLVADAGFGIVALEREIPLVDAVGRYVAGDDADPETVFHVFNVYPWQTEELRGAVEWMRAHRSDGGSVRFTGFDINVPEVIVEMLAEEMPDASLGPLMEAAWSGGAAEWRDLAASADGVAATLREAGAGDVALMVTTVAQYARGRAAFHDAGGDGGGEAAEKAESAVRDAALADNLVSILEAAGPDARVIIWAHNGHVGRFPDSMGRALADRLGDSYVPVGFTFHHGSYSGATLSGEQLDRRLRPFNAQPLVDDAVEHDLESVDLETYWIDVRGDVPNDLARRRPHRLIGLIGGDEEWWDEPLSAAFDVVVHTTESSPARPLSWSDDQIAKWQGF